MESRPGVSDSPFDVYRVKQLSRRTLSNSFHVHFSDLVDKVDGRPSSEGFAVSWAV